LKRIDDFLLERGWVDASDEVYSFVQYYRDPQSEQIFDVGFASEIEAGRYLVSRGWFYDYIPSAFRFNRRRWGWFHPDQEIVKIYGGMSLEVAFEMARKEEIFHSIFTCAPSTDQ
jgi:hypothetical protein